jgi:hypothetical protein
MHWRQQYFLLSSFAEVGDQSDAGPLWRHKRFRLEATGIGAVKIGEHFCYIGAEEMGLAGNRLALERDFKRDQCVRLVTDPSRKQNFSGTG